MKYFAVLFSLGLTGVLRADDATPELRALEVRYDSAHLANHDDKYRQEYIHELAKLRWKLVQEKRDGWEAVDAEVARYPMKPSDDPAVRIACAKARIGTWYSPRHDYLYRADGTWVMDPELNDPETTHGTWAFDGNQYSESVAFKSDSIARYTVILIDSELFIFMDQDPASKKVFYETTSLNRSLPLRRD